MAELKLEPMFESMDIEQEQKVALQESFDNAVIKKTTELLDEHVETKLQEKVEVLEEEYKEKVEGLTESLDGYLDTVVEDFITENAPTYEAQIEESKVTTLLEAFDKMAEVLGVDMLRIQESKDDSEVSNKLEESEDKVSELAEKLVEAKREADGYLKNGLVAEMSEGLTILEKSKFEKLAEMVQFDRSNAYLEKLETIKESIVDSRSEDFVSEVAELPAGAFKQPEKVDSKSAMEFSKYV